MALVIEQWPSFGHWVLSVQAALSVLQWPEMIGQLPLFWHNAPLVLQVPSDGQSPATKQPGAPVREQVPAWSGHWLESVQALPTTLQVPELGQSAAVEQSALLVLHFADGQNVVKVHAGHSSPTQGQTPGGSQDVVHSAGSGGIQVGETRLQTWERTLLHACPVMLVQVCGVTPLHVCGLTLLHDWVPTLAQVCGVKPLQTCPTAPWQVCGWKLPQVCDSWPPHVCGVSLQVWGVPLPQLCGTVPLQVWVSTTGGGLSHNCGRNGPPCGHDMLVASHHKMLSFS
jgi:hypothetical protein